MLRLFGSLTSAALTLGLASSSLTTGDHAKTSAQFGKDRENVAQVITTGGMQVSAEWFDLIFEGTRQSRMPAELVRPKVADTTYKTVCVRLCDGFYFPISFATRRAQFARDAKQCERRCPTHSRLFVHQNPGDDVGAMVDLEGRPYHSLPKALLYRTQYVSDCTCRGNPWDEAALARHRAYAQTDHQRVTGKTAAKVSLTQSAPNRQDRWARRE
jgi:Protein of unknown function (DUF2865)